MRVGLYFLVFGLASGLGAPVQAADNDITVIPSISLNKKKLEFTPRRNPGGINEINESFTTLDIGLTVNSGRFFTSVNYDTSFEDETDVGGQGGYLITRSRTDYGLTLGYTVWKAVSVFGGYKAGELRQEFLGAGVSGPGPVTFRELFQDIEDEGWFLGANYSHNFGSTGALSFSAAYAVFDSEYTGNRLVTPFQLLEVEGETTGYSYGIKWTGFLGKDSSYMLGAKINKYDFEGKDVASSASTMEQDYAIYYIGMSRYY